MNNNQRHSAPGRAKYAFLLLIILALSGALAGANLISENIQSWTNRTSYGSYTQAITAGTVSMTRCMVANAAAATGTCSAGRVQLEASTGILELPALTSAGTAEFHIVAGSTGRSVKLQAYIGSTWTDITTFSGIGTTGATYTYNVNSSSATTLRLASPSHAIYVHDIIITDYAGAPSLPVVVTSAISSITASTAVSGGNVTSDGGSSVTARGVCWSTTTEPTLEDSFTTNGSGTGSFVSNVSGLAGATLYYLRAYATNTTGTVYGDELSFTTSGTSPPAVPVATEASAVTSSSFQANWNAASGASSYFLDVSTSGSFLTFVTGYNNLSVTGTSSAVNGLAESTDYYYRVRAYNSNGTSASSNTIAIATLEHDPFNGYYNSVLGLSGTALKSGLHTILRTTHTTEFSYDNATEQMKYTDEDPNNTNNILEIYTGWSVPKSSYGGGTTDWNKEHTWSKSHGDFGDVAPAGTDLHHLRPCDATVNSAKNNRDFDYGSEAYTDASPPTGYSGTTQCKTGTDIWEPRDVDKGDVARMIMYMAVRYDGDDTTYDLELVDYVPSDEGTNQPYYGKLSTLLAWHQADPPDTWEMNRNNKIYSRQGNRNPFIDHPEYVSYIWGGATATTFVNLQTTGATVSEAGISFTITADILAPGTAATYATLALTTGDQADVGNYTAQTITFPANSTTSQTVTVSITDDSLLEGTEQLVFSLTNVHGGNSAAAGSNYTFTLNITDNDIPDVVATTATGISTSGFTANWQAAAGITSYVFDLSTASDFQSYVSGYEALSVTGTNLPISSLLSGTTYYYRLRAEYNSSFGDYSNVITQATETILVLTDPVAVAATAISHEGFTARWNSVAGATGYYLDVYSGSAALATDLIISEYVEGTSSNKYIEVFNGTGSTVDLSGYKLNLYSNGAASPSSSTAMSGSLANGACAVFRNSSAALTLPEGVTAITNSAVNFNGDDAVSIYKNSISANVDIFGRIGEDPGNFWGTAPLVTADKTLRRLTTVTTGVSTNPTSGFPTLATEWETYGVDTASGLGSHSIGASAPVAGYQNLPVAVNIARVSGLSPQSQYSYKVRAYNAGDETNDSNLIQVSTTAVTNGAGASTAILGEAAQVLVATLPSYTDNSVLIDPTSTTSDDFSILAEAITGGIKYTVTCSNNAALNGAYTLYHTGLNATPANAEYSFGGQVYPLSGFTGDETQTQLTISGLAKGLKGVLEISLTGDQTLPVELSSFTAIINAENYVNLQWVSQSETGVMGYYVLRSPSPALELASVISPLVAATNTSQQQVYSYEDESLTTEGEYYYWLQHLDLDGANGYYGPISVLYQGSDPGAVPPISLITGIRSVYPNPCSDGAHINFELAKASPVSLKIYNSRGQMVRKLDPATTAIGSYRLWWDGAGEDSRACPSGVYFIRMTAGKDVHTHKVLIVR